MGGGHEHIGYETGNRFRLSLPKNRSSLPHIIEPGFYSNMFNVFTSPLYDVCIRELYYYLPIVCVKLRGVQKQSHIVHKCDFLLWWITLDLASLFQCEGFSPFFSCFFLHIFLLFPICVLQNLPQELLILVPSGISIVKALQPMQGTGLWSMLALWYKTSKWLPCNYLFFQCIDLQK